LASACTSNGRSADLPLDLKVPPLMVQPLLENAVYHGIEPGVTGTIRIRLLRRGDANAHRSRQSLRGGAEHQRGNHMALDNIRERLALYYDLEARLDTGEVLLG
jgi:two-component system sensor histidine kinase AlgZ